MRQTGFFDKFMTKTFVFITTKNRPHFNTFQRLLHVMQLQNTVPVMFSKKHFMMHAFKQFKNQKQGFHNNSHLHWHVYIKHPWNICNPPWNQMQWTFRESNYQNYSGCKLTHMDISAMGRDFTLPKLNNKALHGPSVFIQWTI